MCGELGGTSPALGQWAHSPPPCLDQGRVFSADSCREQVCDSSSNSARPLIGCGTGHCLPRDLASWSWCREGWRGTLVSRCFRRGPFRNAILISLLFLSQIRHYGGLFWCVPSSRCHMLTDSLGQPLSESQVLPGWVRILTSHLGTYLPR